MYLIVLPNLRRKFTKMAKKKYWNFENFILIFSAVEDLFFSKLKKWKLFLSYCANAINSHYFRCKQNWHAAVSLTQLDVQPGADIRCENSWQIKADTVHAMVLLLCHTYYTPAQPETPGLIDNTLPNNN